MEKEPNAEQRQVIDELKNNLIVFASAGTGKTFTVAKRVANILSQGLATPDEILCLTFTIKACNELKEDILAWAEEVPSVHTIHGFCYKLLQEEYKRTGAFFGELGVIDEVDQEEILQKILSTRFYSWKIENALQETGVPMPDLQTLPVYQAEGLEGFVWRTENLLITPQGEVFPIENRLLTPFWTVCPVCGAETEIQEGACSGCGGEIRPRVKEKKFEIYAKKNALRNLVSALKHRREEWGTENYVQTFARIQAELPTLYEGLVSHYAGYVGYSPDEQFALAMEKYIDRLVQEYDEHLQRSNLLDFDDLILKANAILKKEEGLAYWSKKYRYIILDEMQDTSTLEYELLKKLFAQNNVMLCGDFFQTIYGWRGSCPEQILEDYIRAFSAKIYSFSENYRSTQTLSRATFGYLQNTYPMLMGKYAPKALEIHSQEEGEKIFCYAFDNREQEAWQIYKYLCKHKPQTPLDICIIARSNKYIAELSAYFTRFDREREGKDGLSFFTVEENFQFFKKPVIKDLLALLKLLVSPTDRVSMERLAEKFVKKVGNKSVENFRGYQRIGVSILSFLDSQTYAFGDSYFRLLEGYAEENIVVYDTETTGLDVSMDEIIQLSAIKIGKKGKVLDTLDIFIEPTREIAQAAYETHGFDVEYIRSHGGTSAAKALEQFSSFADGCVLVGHNNLAYDAQLLARQFRETGVQPPHLLAEYDTLLIAKQFYPQLENYKLATLCAHFGVTNESAHNALGDITATGQCLVRIIEESVQPTALERTAFLVKHREKFLRFFEFFQEVRARVEKGEEFAAYCVEKLQLCKRYPSAADGAAIRDMIESLQTDKADVRAFLKEYIRDASLAGSQMDVLIAKFNRIPIITVHQAKGCEFKTVLLAGADDSNFPSYGARQSGNEDEEKKVFYVAISRAKERLILTRALRNGRYELKETPYFWKIPQEYTRVNRAW